MAFYEIEMRHTEKSFEALARKQYDLFCKRNRIVRTLLSAGLLVFGVTEAAGGWGILLVAYGCYLLTSTYSAANHTAHKLVQQLKDSGLDFPASRYVFEKNAMRVISLPEETPLGEPLRYADILRLGEDREYLYIFRDSYGGYMLPKAALGEKEDAFRAFLEEKTGQSFRGKGAPVVRLARWLKEKRKRA